MDDTVNAFHSLFEVAGAVTGPLVGMTFGSKDIFDVEGHVTGCGNPDWAASHPAATSHAPPVATLLNAGARLVGKTHTDELAYSLMGVNEHYGTPVNTAAPDRVPGGSSSGSVAATAARLVDIGLGSDTGGSVRMPASFCGVWGIRTSHGRFSLDRTMALATSYDALGWFTRDLDAMHKVAHAFGMEGGEPATRFLFPVDAWARASAATVAALGPALALLQTRLGPLTPVLLAKNGLAEWREAFRLYQGHEIWQVHGDWISKTAPAFGGGVGDRFAMAQSITEDEFLWAKAEREKIADHLLRLFSDETVMVLPTSPGPAPMRDSNQMAQEDFRARALEMLCPAGHAGLPQLSIPAGTVDGGPVGLSLMGPRNGEEMLFATAERIR